MHPAEMPQSRTVIVGMRQLLAMLWLVAAGGVAAAEEVPLPPPRPSPPPATIRPTACDLRLAKIAIVETMPPVTGPGACGDDGMVRMPAVLLTDGERVAIKPTPSLRCPMAEQLALWLREQAAPLVGAAGPALREIANFDDYECRSRNRVNGAKVSEHGKGNAIDLRGFTLADGRFIGLTDVAAPKALREDLRQAACERFTTVLGPGSDSHHEGHIHLDLIERRNGYRICQWDVREPQKPRIAGVSVPLPMPRPAMADRTADGRKL